MRAAIVVLCAMAVAGCSPVNEKAEPSPTPRPKTPTLTATPDTRPVAGVRVERVARGLKEPTAITGVPGEPDALLVAERKGTVRLLEGGRLAPEPVLDLRALVATTGLEQGVLGLAVSPDRRHLYAQVTDRSNDLRTLEFRLGRDLRPEPRSRRTVLVIEHPLRKAAHGIEEDLRVHNGGQLAFDRDGRLWVATGDGGGQGDPFERAQDLDELLGKLLKLDPRRRRARPQIMAYGLRNPFRFTFHPETGEVIVSDAGQFRVEEINLMPGDPERPVNFGWNCYEGSEPFTERRRLLGERRGRPCEPPGHVRPVIERPSSGVARRCASVIGGYVVRDPALTRLRGRYVYADFCESRLRSAIVENGRARDDREHGLTIPWPSTFGEDDAGRLYVAAFFAGELLRFVPAR